MAKKYDPDKRAQKRLEARRRKMAKKVLRPSDEAALSGGMPGAYELGKDKRSEYKKDRSGKPERKYRSRESMYVIPGVKETGGDYPVKSKELPEERVVEKQTTVTKGPTTQDTYVQDVTGRKLLMKKGEVVDKGGQQVSKTDPKIIKRETIAEGKDQEKTKSRVDDPLKRSLHARMKETGMRDPDYKLTVKRKGRNPRYGGGGKMKTVRKYYGDIPESAKTEEREKARRAAARFAGGKLQDVTQKVRGSKLITKTKRKRR